MGFEHLFAEDDLALLSDWLEQTGELYMDLDRPHSGGSNNSVHFIRSLADLRAIVARETHPEVSISIFRRKQYPLRGVADAGLLAAALELIPDHQWFSILSPCADPLIPGSVVGFGDRHEELREEFVRLEGRPVWVGQNPFDLLPPNDAAILSNPEEVFFVGFHKSLKSPPRVVRNR
jgi:hypothetical protein